MFNCELLIPNQKPTIHENRAIEKEYAVVYIDMPQASDKNLFAIEMAEMVTYLTFVKLFTNVSHLQQRQRPNRPARWTIL